jgi:hypothetical protein
MQNGKRKARDASSEEDSESEAELSERDGEAD